MTVPCLVPAKIFVSTVGALVVLGGTTVVAPHRSTAQVDTGTAVTVRHLAELRDIGGTQAGLSISPTGRWVVYNLRQGDPDRNEYHNQWILLDLATKESRVLVEDAGPPLLSYGDGLRPVDDYNQGIQAFSPVWSSDEQTLLYVRKDQNGIRLHRLDVSTGISAPVSQLPQGKVMGLAHDAGAARVTLEVESASALETERRRRAQGALFTGNEVSPARGIPTFRTLTERQTLRIDPGTGNPLGPAEERPDACDEFPGWPRDQDLTMMFMECEFDANGRPVAVGIDNTVARRSFAIYAAAAGETERLSPSHDWIYGLTWHEGQAYYVGQEGYSKSDIYEVSPNGRARPITQSTFFLNNCVFNFEGAPFAVCTAETLNTPRELARIDLGDGSIEVLTDLNPEYNRLQLPETKEIAWTSPGGDAVQGTLTYPVGYDSSRSYPVVVTSYPHPGFARGSNGDEFPIPVFAAQGFLVLDVDAPVAHYWTALDISFETYVRGYDSPLRGLEAYLQKLGTEGIADLSRVGVCGLSGGATFSAYAVSHSRFFAAAIFGWDETDYLWRITLATDRSREQKGRHGLGIADTTNWQAFSLGLRADSVDAAVLLNVADSEFLRAFGSYDALKRSGSPVEMWIYPDAHHVKWLPGQRLSVYDRNVDWFNYWLRDVRDASAAKAEQYKRWDELKARWTSRSNDGSGPSP